MRIKRIIAVVSLVGSSLFVGVGTASASCQGICTPPVTTDCAEVSSGGAQVGPGTQVTIHQHDVTIHSVGDCI